MNKGEFVQAVTECRIFKVGNSFPFAVQIPDNEVGISGSRCTYCGSSVAYCEQICKHCDLPLIGPTGFPQLPEWRKLSTSEKLMLVEEVYTQDRDAGRLGYPNARNVPLNFSDLETIECLRDEDARLFKSAHGIWPA